MSILAALWLPDEGWGQACSFNCPELIRNNQLELNPDVAPNPMNSNAYQTFNMGWVNDWQASHGSPHHFVITTCNSLWSTWGPNVKNCLGASYFNMEGIYTEVSLTDDPFVEYCLNLDIQKIHCGQDNIVEFNTSLTKNLIPIGPNPVLQTPPYEPSNPNQELTSTLLTNLNMQHISQSFKVTSGQNFNQLWFKMRYRDPSTTQAGNGGIATLKNISLKCKTEALTDITTKIDDCKVTFGTTNASAISTFEIYNWNFGDPASGVNNTSTDSDPIHFYYVSGMYKVCVDIIDNNGCCTQRCEDVEIDIEEPNFYIYTDGDCPVFSFRAIGVNNDTAGYTYVWDFGDGFSDSSKFVSHTYTQNGTYTVTCVVTNECRAQSTETVTVTVLLPTAAFTITENCPVYNFVAQNESGSTYVWNFGDNTTGSDSNISHSYNTNGNYAVTLIVTNNCGSDTVVQNVNVNCVNSPSSCNDQTGCISIGTDVNSQTLLSDLINGTNPVIPSTNGFFGIRVIQGGCFSLKGLLIIDVMTDMRNTQWYCGPGSRIEVRSWVFYSTGSVFQGCDEMWRGFVVPSSNGILFGNGFGLVWTTVRDAWHGIELSNGAAVVARDCKFIDNYIGISLGAPNSQNNYIYNKISSCTFESQYTMLPEYSDQESWSPIMEKGIDANGVGLLDVFSESNELRGTFKNVKIGIHAKSSNLTIEENNFIHETPMSNGYGILCQNMSGIANITNDNHFTNIYRSIEFNGGQGTAVNISENVFESQLTLFSAINHKGIYVLNHPTSAVSIINNNFIYSRGIDVDIMGGLSYLGIIGNDFYINGVQNVPMVIKNVHSGSKIIGNDFYNTGLYIVNQTQMRDCSLFTVEENVSHESDINAGTMFYLDGVNKCIFRNNRIENKGIQFAVNGSEIVTGNGYCCNSTTKDEGATSMQFSDANGESKVRQNTIRSLVLDGTGDIGSQLNAGNIWRGANSLAKMLGATEQRAQDNAFTVSQMQPEGTPNVILTEPVDVSSIWFNQVNVISPDCTSRPDCDIQPYFSGPYNPDLTIPNQDTSGVVPSPSQDCKELLHSLDHALGLKSSDNPKDQIKYWNALIQLDYWMGLYGEEYWADCIEWKDILDEHVKEWVAVADEIKKLEISFDPETEIVCGNTMQLLKDAIGNATDVNPYDIMDITQQIKLTYEEISTYHTQYQSYINQGMIKANVNAEKLKVRVNALSAPYAFLEGRKLVWSAMLQKFQNGLAAITSAEWYEIAITTAKCPSEGGQAVYEAINLLEQNGTYVTVNRSCNQPSPRSKNEIQDQILVYPNPTTGAISIEIPDAIEADELFVYNLQGKVVYLTKITGNGTIIHLNFLEPGIYFYSLTNKNQKITDGKFVLIK